MLERTRDQAQGLRRMFRPGEARVIEVLAATEGVGRRTVAAHLADALARAGRETVLLDAAGCRGVRPGLAAQALDDSLALPLAGRGGDAAPDYIVMAAAVPHALPWTGGVAPLDLLVVSPNAPAITAAYAWIKRLCPQCPGLQLNVLVNRVRSEVDAMRAVANLARAARAYLGVRLHACGFVPQDSALAAADAQGRSVLQTDPEAPASRAFRRLADRLVRLAPAAVAAGTPASIRTAERGALRPLPL